MCWNEPISWITFILGTALCSYGSIRSKTNLNRWIYFFFQLVLMVQLGEALVWRDPHCNTIGKIGTAIAFFGVWLQPLFGAYILSLLSPTWVLIVYDILLLIYCIVSVPILQDVMTNCYVPLCEDNCLRPHLSYVSWDSTPMSILYIICIIILLVVMFPTYPYVSSYVAITMILSFILYKKTFGSLWCWFGAFTPLVCILSGV